MKVKIMTLIAAVVVLASCTNLRYTDYGKPFDFLKAKRDVVKPQGKVEVESVQVQNNTNSETVQVENAIIEPTAETVIPTEKESKEIVLVPSEESNMSTAKVKSVTTANEVVNADNEINSKEEVKKTPSFQNFSNSSKNATSHATIKPTKISDVKKIVKTSEKSVGELLLMALLIALALTLFFILNNALGGILLLILLIFALLLLLRYFGIL
jgi:delta 1-pyrroline-5-carboxylate dehydrogenase